MDPWFSEQMSGIIGGGIGAFIGVVYGGLGGGVGGALAGAGRAKGLVVGIYVSGIVLGVLLMLTALVALVLGQPWHVALAFGPAGGLIALLMGLLLPVLLAQYAKAEQWKMDAAAIRGG